MRGAWERKANDTWREEIMKDDTWRDYFDIRCYSDGYL